MDFLIGLGYHLPAEVVGERTARSMGLNRGSNQCIGRAKPGFEPGKPDARMDLGSSFKGAKLNRRVR